MVENLFKMQHYLEMKHKNLKKLGNNIKLRRKALKLSQENLAELINKSRNYIGMVERAEVNISINSLFEIADALKTEAVEFFKFD